MPMRAWRSVREIGVVASVPFGVFRYYYMAICTLLWISVFGGFSELVFRALECTAHNVSTDFLSVYCANKTLFTESQWENGVYIPGNEYKRYKWINFQIIFQTVFFCVPYFAWLWFEWGKIKRLADYCAKMNKTSYISSAVLFTRNWQTPFVIKFVVCEIVALLINFILLIETNGYFTSNPIQYDLYEQIKNLYYFVHTPETLLKSFPDTATCTYVEYDNDNRIHNVIHAQCNLPLNEVYRSEIYILWYYELFMFTLTCLSLVYRIVSVFSIDVRIYSLRCGTKHNQLRRIRIIAQEMSYSRWFVLVVIKQNMTPSAYNRFTDLLANRLV